MTKKCPKCGQSFADPNLNFCLNDGEMLRYEPDPPASRPFQDPPPTQFAREDSPPTLMMNDPRSTDPVGMGASSPLVQSPGQKIYSPPGHYPVELAPPAAPNQLFGILSLVFGACSMTIGWCCSSGLLLGPAAIILGIIGLVQNKKDPLTYGGRGMSIAGIALGGLFLLAYILLIILYGIAIIGGGLN